MYRRVRFQFTLRQLLLATFWFSLTFACLNLVFRSSEWLLLNFPLGMVVLVPFVPAVLGALCGASIGSLCHRTAEFAFNGFFLLPILCVGLFAGLILLAVILLAIFG